MCARFHRLTLAVSLRFCFAFGHVAAFFRPLAGVLADSGAAPVAQAALAALPTICGVLAATFRRRNAALRGVVAAAVHFAGDETFHESLDAGSQALEFAHLVEALRQAQMHALRFEKDGKRIFAAPGYWVAFELIGDYR